jgi:hypothetical protein
MAWPSKPRGGHASTRNARRPCSAAHQGKQIRLLAQPRSDGRRDRQVQGGSLRPDPTIARIRCQRQPEGLLGKQFSVARDHRTGVMGANRIGSGRGT